MSPVAARCPAARAARISASRDSSHGPTVRLAICLRLWSIVGDLLWLGVPLQIARDLGPVQQLCRCASRIRAPCPPGTTASARSAAASRARPARAGTAPPASAPAAARRYPERPSRATNAVAAFRSGLTRTSVTVMVSPARSGSRMSCRAEDGREHVADFLRHAQLPLARVPWQRAWTPAQPGTISTSKHSTTSPSLRSL